MRQRPRSLPSIATRWPRKQGLVNVVETNSVYSPQCFLHKERLVPICPLNIYKYIYTALIGSIKRAGVIGVEDEGYAKQSLSQQLAYAL